MAKSENESLILIQKFLRENPEVTYIDTFSLICPEEFAKIMIKIHLCIR